MLVRCDGECVNLDDNVRNCGRCDAPCSEGQSCVAGVCRQACVPETTLCGDECRPLATDHENCGACGVACARTEACLGGACSCRDKWTRCDEDCVDLFSDDRNCGACAAACTAPAVCVAGSCRATSVGWSTLGFDMQRGGVNADESGLPGDPAWTRAVADVQLNPVAVERGRVVVSARTRFEKQGPVSVLAADTGETLWSHDFGPVEDVGQPSIVDGRVYVQHANDLLTTDNAMLYCLDAASGDVLWSSIIAAQWEHYWAPAVGATTVYVDGGTFGGMYAFEKDSGMQRFFSSDLEQYDEWAPTLVDGGVLSMTEGNLRFHDPDTGVVDWEVSVKWSWVGWSMHTLVPESDGRAYLTAPPTLYEIGLADRAVHWQADGGYVSFPALTAGRIFAPSTTGLAALERASGNTLWSFEVPGGVAYPPVATSRHVYVSSTDTVYAVAIEDGSLAWQHSGAGWLSIGSGFLLVAGGDGTLTAFPLEE